MWWSLQWRHNERDGVSSHQPHDCLLHRLFGRGSKKTSKLRITGLCAGNSPGPVNSQHKELVMQKMFYLMTSSWFSESLHALLQWCHRRVKASEDSLRPRQNGQHFSNDIFNCIFLNENVWMKWLKFVPKGPIDNNTALFKIIAWHRDRRKAIIWTNDDLCWWRINASLGLIALISSTDFWSLSEYQWLYRDKGVQV